MKRGLVVLIAALIFAAPLQGFAQYHSINSTASWLALRKVSVHCLTPEEARSDYAMVIWGADAYVEGAVDYYGRWHPKDFTVFNYGICETLIALSEGKAGQYSLSQLALALMVLTHESGHLRGHRWSESEAETQRWALRHVVYTAKRFGIGEPAARLILYHAIKLHNQLSDDYKHPNCAHPSQDKQGLLKNCK